MPLPFLPIISALAAGGTLVPHAAGGMIVTSATGYVSGTYMSTALISTLLTTTTTAVGASTLYLSGAASSIIGTAGYFGTTIGATGLKGTLMSLGIISSTPVWKPIAAGGLVVTGLTGICYGGYRFYKLRKKLANTIGGKEAFFTESEANFVERLIRKIFYC